jgi:transcription initiation factor IIE alpha subunit
MDQGAGQMEAREVPVVVHTAPAQQTVYNPPMDTIKRTRRPFLSRDILKVLKKHPLLTRKEIAIKTRAKGHSVKAVLFKLVAAGKITCEKGTESTAKTGPRMVNVYCLKTEPKIELENHG